MKAEELMVGDWVMCDNTPFEVLNIISEETDNIADIKSNNEYDTFLLSTMQPIPITPDILVLNGFKPMGSELYDIINQEYSIRKKDYYLFYSFKYGKEFSCENHKNGKRIYISLDYVHELQHALRLCDVNKEIIIR